MSNLTCANVIQPSDLRLKSQVRYADTQYSYDAIRQIPLKTFSWNNSEIDTIGWIAQDVEINLPLAVTEHDLYGFSNCKMLNIYQIISHMFGAIQKLQEKVEQLQKEKAE